MCLIVGPAIGRFAMDLAIQKAKAVGIGFVTVKGIYYLEML